VACAHGKRPFLFPLPPVPLCVFISRSSLLCSLLERTPAGVVAFLMPVTSPPFSSIVAILPPLSASLSHPDLNLCYWRTAPSAHGAVVAATTHYRSPNSIRAAFGATPRGAMPGKDDAAEIIPASFLLYISLVLLCRALVCTTCLPLSASVPPYPVLSGLLWCILNPLYL